MTSEEALAEYISEHYGTCIRGSSLCVCLREGRNPACPHWLPTKAKTYAEMIELAKKMYAK